MLNEFAYTLFLVAVVVSVFRGWPGWSARLVEQRALLFSAWWAGSLLVVTACLVGQRDGIAALTSYYTAAGLVLGGAVTLGVGYLAALLLQHAAWWVLRQYAGQPAKE